MSVSLFKYLGRPHVYLDNLRNVATILGSLLIPVAITVASRQRERKRATLDLLRRFTSGKELTARLDRLYRYRLFDTGGLNAANPYAADADLVSDSILLLNFCDTIAIEAEAGLIDKTMLMRALGPTLIGARDVVLKRLNTAFRMDTGAAYEDFSRLAARVDAYQARKGRTLVTKIPNWTSPNFPPKP